MRFFYLIMAVLVMASGTTLAQVGYGPEIGLNMSTYYGKSHGLTLANGLKYGGTFGGVAEVELDEHWFLLPGLFYLRNGYTSKLYVGGKIGFNQDETQTTGINTIEIPVNIQYKFGGPKQVRFFVGIGPYVAANVTGSVQIKGPVNNTRNIQIGHTTDNDIKIWDAGLGINGVYQVTEGLFFRLRYQMGLVNMNPYGNADNTLKNYSFGITMGYIFPGDLKAKKEGQDVNGSEEKNK